MVRIEVLADGFQVCDNGPGVTDFGTPGRFVEAFASSRQQGTDLGLHPAFLIAQAHGAKLIAKSNHAQLLLLEWFNQRIVKRDGNAIAV